MQENTGRAEKLKRGVEDAAKGLSEAFAALEAEVPAPNGYLWCVMGDGRLLLVPVEE